MGINSRQIKDRAMEIFESDEYQEARNEEFNEQFRDFLSGNIEAGSVFSEDDIQGFMDSFDFPSEEDYAMGKACSEADEWADAKYEEMKERRMGIV